MRSRTIALTTLSLALFSSSMLMPARAEGPASDPQFTAQRNQEQRDDDKIMQDMEKKRNKERYESLKKDTDKLYAMATELKESVEKSNEHTLSLDVVRKTEEIEKLSKKIREKMKGD